MILGIGTDLVEVSRFAMWRNYKKTTLSRIFSLQEIAYCLEKVPLSAQRFAVRFAAKEALVKALFTAGLTIPFLSLCRAVSIVHNPSTQVPSFLFNDDFLYREQLSLMKMHLSLSHTKEYACAYVILEKNM